MEKKEVKRKIIDFLEREKIGITVTQLANKIGVSRPTIYKYIRQLKKEGVAEEIIVGGKNFWTLKSSSPVERVRTLQGLKYILEKLVQTFMEDFKPDLKWRELGRCLAPRIEEDVLLDTLEPYGHLINARILPHQLQTFFIDHINRELFRISPADAINDALREFIRAFIPFVHEIHTIIFSLIDVCPVHNPEFDEKSLIFRIRLIKPEIFVDKNSIEFILGLLERKFELMYGNRLTIRIDVEIDEKNETYDYIYKIRTTEKFIKDLLSAMKG